MSETERAYVCAVLHDEDVMYRAAISPNDLSDIVCRKIIEVCKSLSVSGSKPDLAAVCFELRDIVPISEINEIYDMGAYHVNWKHYTDKLNTEIMGRKIESLFPQLREWIDSGSNPHEIIANASEYLDNIAIGFNEYKIQGFREIIPPLLDDLQEKMKAKSLDMVGIDTGIPMLNELTGGWKKRELIYIGGRPSDGKSAALNGFLLAAVHSGHNPGVISVESSLKEIIRRCLSTDSQVPMNKIKTGFIGKKQTDMVTQSAAFLYDHNPYGYDEPNATMQTVITQARRLVSIYGVDCLYIDYIQQITPSVRRSKRNEEVADMSKALKSLARELDIPIIVAAQLTRPQKGRENNRPLVSDFGESSQIEKDGDIEILIWHKENPDTDTKDSYLLLEKQRDGETADIPVYFNREIVRFEEKSL